MDIKDTILNINNLKENIIIDCGHIAIFSNSDCYSFGRYGSPSDSEIETLKLGIDLLNHLRINNKKVLLSICLSDLAGISGGNKERNEILRKIKDGKKEEYIPEVYKTVLKENDLTLDDVVLNLQSKGNEKFKKIIRRVRSDITKASKELDYSKRFFEKYNSLFLTSNSKELFSLTTPYLTDTTVEDKHFKGQWWKENDTTIRESALVELPLLRLKKNPIVNLYETGGKVLCPATYSGLLSHFDNNVDHIAIYSRSDDEYIGEKIIRGVISSNALYEHFSRNCIQIIISKNGALEVSVIHENEIRDTTCDYDKLTHQLEQHLITSGTMIL